MADLARASRRGRDDPYDFKAPGPYDGSDDARAAPRRRGAAGGRGRGGGRRKADKGLLLWRMLALSASVLILAMGAVLAYRMTRPVGQDGGRQDGAREIAAAPAAPTPATTPPTLATPADPGHARMATKVASILGTAPGAPAPAPARADAVQAAPIPPAAPVAASEPAPTAADFARPAFLEPAAGDEADLPESATETVSGEPPAAEAAPAPKDRATASGEGRTARIRSAVTLRSGPRRSASAIGTLNAGTQVTLYSCKSWCEVSSGDKRGYVYRSAVAQ